MENNSAKIKDNPSPPRHLEGGMKRDPLQNRLRTFKPYGLIQLIMDN